MQEAVGSLEKIVVQATLRVTPAQHLQSSISKRKNSQNFRGDGCTSTKKRQCHLLRTYVETRRRMSCCRVSEYSDFVCTFGSHFRRVLFPPSSLTLFPNCTCFPPSRERWRRFMTCSRNCTTSSTRVVAGTGATVHPENTASPEHSLIGTDRLTGQIGHNSSHLPGCTSILLQHPVRRALQSSSCAFGRTVYPMFTYNTSN